jgi:hypothetical protein
MSFILGSILYIALMGGLDARLSWPAPAGSRARKHASAGVRQ